MLKQCVEVDRPVRTYHCVFEMFLAKRRIELSVNILIAFEKAISLSASILIASADALIVAERPIMIVEKLKNLTFLQLVFCCHIL